MEVPLRDYPCVCVFFLVGGGSGHSKGTQFLSIEASGSAFMLKCCVPVDMLFAFWVF